MAKKKKPARPSRIARKPAAVPPRAPGSFAARPASTRHRAVAAPPVVRPVAGPIAASLTVVGIGASAGGLEAFSQVLRAMPEAHHVAIVFVQHLSPQHESTLVPLLASQTTMTVVQVTEGMRVEPDHVYVIPPNVQMAMRGRDLHLAPRPKDRSKYTPIDAFLISLADAVQDRAIAVILSGTASDGSIGLRAVKNAGGLTLAQIPDSAKYDGMPRAAIDTGMVDLVLTPQAIGEKLADISSRGRMPPTRFTDEHEVGGDDLLRIFDLLRPASGVDFQHYKLPTIKRRLFRRMALHRITDVPAYVHLLEQNPGEVRSLYHDLLIHVTRFFRDPESFAGLATEVFPAILEDRPADHPIRVWVSGCATGEEAYSLAICLIEFLQKDHADVKLQIFATDVSDSAIEFARAGVYPTSIEADVSTERLRQYFTRIDGGYRVAKMVRDACVFARQDLTKDAPFSHLDIIMCRNVLIYMDAVLQKKLLSVFHYALNPGGFLMLGQAESVGAQATHFALVDKKLRIHRKKDAPTLPAMAFPVDHGTQPGTRGRKAGLDGPGAEKILQVEVSRAIIDRYAPPGVVVDSDLQIVQFRGQTGAFLEPAPGEASLNLLKMAREGLLYGLRTTLQAARKNRVPVRKTGLQVKSGSSWRPVTLDVIPLTTSGRLHYLVLFDGRLADGSPPAAPPAAPAETVRGRKGRGALQLLQRELAASREYLQSIIQELEAANEDLQSANEEILSSNEELQSTNEELDTAKEELQSTNEELNTVNEELHGTNEELGRVNSDLINLLASVQIAIVIVNTELRIRRFTPMAEKVLNLIPTDLNRSIGHINPNIDCPNLEQLMADCIDNVAVIERDVKDRQGRWYLLRIRPYKDVDNRIDGAVLALFDTDGPRRSEERARAATDLARCLVDMTAQPVALTDAELRVTLFNGAFARLLEKTAAEIRDLPLADVVPAAWDLTSLRDLAAAEPGNVRRLAVTAGDGAGGNGQRWLVDACVQVSHETPPSRQLVLLASRPATA